MKIRNIYRTLVILAIAVFTTASGQSQNMLQGEPSQEIREQADEAVEMWTDELSLTTKQADLMEKKIIEFAMKRQELLQSKMREEEKTERLKALQISEINDMRDILTGRQHERYIAIQEERAQSQQEGGNQSQN